MNTINIKFAYALKELRDASRELTDSIFLFAQTPESSEATSCAIMATAKVLGAIENLKEEIKKQDKLEAGTYPVIQDDNYE